MKRKQSTKLQMSFKENARDLDIYNFLVDEIKDSIGVSTYLKLLVEKDERYKEYRSKKN